MTAEKSGLVISKVTLAVAGVVAVGLIIGSGLIGHFAFPYEPSNGSDTPLTSADPEVTTPIPPEEVTDFRLPTSLTPTHYKVELKPFVNGNFSILGRVVVDIEVKIDTSNITIHMADIITFNDTIKVTHNGNQVAITEHTYDPTREFYVGHLEKKISAGESITLEMSFQAYLNDQMRGFYRSSYLNANGSTVYLAGTQFQATDARRAFPCFDEPALKAKFTVSLARETTMTTLSNMPLNRSEEIDDTWVWDHYETSVPMSTYLVAFLVSNFEYEAAPGDDTFKVWTRPEALEQAAYSLEVGPKVLRSFETYFDIPYTLPKLDMVAITDFEAGAMENWGLILYRETAMLYDTTLSSASNKQRVGLVITHELAHQWFGNLVSPAWWEDLWLNEGFASYMEFVGLEVAEPTWNMGEQFLILALHEALSIDSLESSHAIRFPVGHPDTILEIFDGITYSKGASLVWMMEHFLTNEIYKQGLIKYMNAFEFKAASQDDLWQYLDDASTQGTQGILPESVKDIMDTWTLQMGYPVLTVTRSGTSFTISQSRFLLVEPGVSQDERNYSWWIPVSYTYLNNPDATQTGPKHWLLSVKIKPILTATISTDDFNNVQATGYYRVNYDEASWAGIISNLKGIAGTPSKIPVINRAQLVDDAMALALAGKLKYETALDVTKYLYEINNEDQYVPWSTAKSNFAYLETMMRRSDAYGLLQTYLRKLMANLYTAVGFGAGATKNIICSISSDRWLWSGLASMQFQTVKLMQLLNLARGLRIQQVPSTQISKRPSCVLG
ncbi:aminopeptidase N-like [Macrobrachium rosenbergii]|uniref:aminopeptidase N-like n=1 Tax=Macrobrachium rosenbergii TaxID=79674 RepID=UPI0034D43D43